MNLLPILLFTQLPVPLPNEPPIETEGFNRALVERLTRAYAALGPVETATLGGGDVLTLDEVLASVEAHHPVLVAAAARVRGARGDRLAAEGGFDPKLKAKGQVTPEGFYDIYGVESILEQPTALWGIDLFGGYDIIRATNFPSYDSRETLDRGEVKGGLRVPLLQGGWIDPRRAELRTSALQIAEAEALQGADALDLAVSGADAYWSWVAEGESYRVVLALVRLAEARGAQIDIQVDAGAAPEIDRAENLRALLKRREKLVQTQRKLEKAGIKLSLFYRGDNAMPKLPSLTQLPPGVPPGEPLPPIELERGTTRALADRPELVALAAELEANRVVAELANNQVLPRLDLELTVEKDLGDDRDPKTIEALDPLVVKAGVAVDFPLFLRKGRGKAEKAQAKVDSVEAKLAFTRDKIEAEVRDLWSLLSASAARAEVARQAAEVAEAVAEGERARLAAGSTSPFVVNLREQAAADARLVEIEARADLQVALTAWRMVTLVGADAPEP